jgi:hypothetical protein
VFQISSKNIAVGGRFDRHRGNPPGAANRAQQSERAPAATGRAFPHSLAPQGASIAPCHVGADATFIQEDQFFRIDLPGLFLPDVAGDLTGGGVLLGGVQRLFLSRSSISPSNFHKRPMLAASASSSRIFLCNSCSVKSGCAVIHSRARCCTSAVNLLRRPRLPAAGRSARPVRRNVADTSLAQPTLC